MIIIKRILNAAIKRITIGLVAIIIPCFDRLIPDFFVSFVFFSGILVYLSSVSIKFLSDANGYTFGKSNI
jgi:hypothetical protein